MRVLVTGATGFVGLHTALALFAAGHDVRLGVRNPKKMQQLYDRHGVDVQDYTLVEVTDRDSVHSALDGCDGLVHTAAMVSLDPADAELAYNTNVAGTRLMIGSAVERGLASIVHVSSAAALFDPGLHVIDENAPLSPARTSYARSKAAADRYVQEQLENGANIAITYPTGVIGPDDPSISEGNESLRFLLNNFHINTSSGLQVVDVRDLARAQRALLEAPTRGRFLVSGHYVPWRELGDMLEKISARRLRRVPVPGPVLRAAGTLVDLIRRVHPVDSPVSREATELATRWVYCDDSKLRATLALDHRPLEETLRDTVAWLAAAGHVDTDWARNLTD
ncbi:MAG: SDR family NAD(P)-dependent oxidoreductase [Halioglobus sp.]|nr:SDR family NAD(P)-dependent oxidoreductase [Halioglobus sp.]